MDTQPLAIPDLKDRMLAQRLSRRHSFVVAAMFLVMAMTCHIAEATEGFFGAVSLGHEYVDVDYSKQVSLDIPPPSSRLAGDAANGSVGAFTMSVGYRWFPSDRVYLSGEVEGALYFNEQVNGFLKGTGTGDRDVWPGDWQFEKNHSVGFNARVGYVPGTLDFLGEGRSVYLISGVSWLDTNFHVDYDNSAGVTGTTRADRNETRLSVGAGLEFGSLTNRFDLRFQHTAYDLDRDSGDGLTPSSPRIHHEFDIEEWKISLGYTKSF